MVDIVPASGVIKLGLRDRLWYGVCFDHVGLSGQGAVVGLRAHPPTAAPISCRCPGNMSPVVCA